MKSILALLTGVASLSLAVAQDKPRIATGEITGDAANGGPIGSASSAEVRDSGFNTNANTGGSTASTPTPSPTPKKTPAKPIH